MMKKTLLFLLLLPALLQAQDVANIGVLFDSLKTHPAFFQDSIRVQQANTGKSMAYSKLYPKLDLFGKYDYSSSAMGMMPLPLDVMASYLHDPSLAQPFSNNIFRVGASISMPIFVASIFPMAHKAKLMAKSAQDMQYINLLKNEAVIVGANSNLQYMQSLDQALQKKKASLSKTKEFVEMMVRDGRAPESALLKINNGLNQIEIIRNSLAMNREEALSMIQSLTGLRLNAPLEMTQNMDVQADAFRALDPLRNKMEADMMSFRAEKKKLLPALMLQGRFSSNYANSYNNKQSVHNDYTYLGVFLKVPIFEKDQYTHIKMSRLDYEYTKTQFDKMSLDMEAHAVKLQNNLTIIGRTIELTKASIKDKEQLLDVAKASFEMDQMPMEDYLKYEDDLVMEKSKLYKAQAEKWQTIMKLSVIYGNNIEEIVK
jgi:outer membrane protein TolC